jgi:hypothetical protein
MWYPMLASPGRLGRLLISRGFRSWLGTLLLAGCATVPAPQYPRDHPANPEASAAPSSPTASVLSTYRAADARLDTARPTPSDSPAPGDAEKGQSHEHAH